LKTSGLVIPITAKPFDKLRAVLVVLMMGDVATMMERAARKA